MENATVFDSLLSKQEPYFLTLTIVMFRYFWLVLSEAKKKKNGLYMFGLAIKSFKVGIIRKKKLDGLEVNKRRNSFSSYVSFHDI
jgi:hypothetical protein